MKNQITATLALNAKINLGNYESADVYVSVTGLAADTTEQQVRDVLDSSVETAYGVLKGYMHEKVRAIRDNRRKQTGGA
jgi:hypothetical protein